MRFLPLSPPLAPSFKEFLARLAGEPGAEHFRPHGMDAAAASTLCSTDTKDFHAVLTREDAVLAYGLLRGWQDGWAVPSLGIAVAPEHRGMGVGRIVMGLLHLEARLRGADRIRLRVHPANAAAMGLYRSLGYRFSDEADRGQMVGFLSLAQPQR